VTLFNTSISALQFDKEKLIVISLLDQHIKILNIEKTKRIEN